MTNSPGHLPELASALDGLSREVDRSETSRPKYLTMSQPQAQTPDLPESGEVETVQPSVIVAHEGLRLHTTFQSIISVGHSKIVGHEALLRGQDDNDTPLSPAELFPQLVATLSAREVNRLCARLHMESFAAQAGEGWLFLNVSPDSMNDREEVVRQFGELLRETGLAPHQVVVEVIETRSVNETELAEAVAGFRDLGCLVAIDDFGAGESNFERVWRFRPDLVKLDRAMITEAAVNPLVRRILPGIVSLIHEAGCLVVMEGIETEEQALIAVESDVDFVQGFYFSRPHLRRHSAQSLRHQFDALAGRIRSTREERSALDRGHFGSYMGPLEACVIALENGLDFHEACAPFLAIEGVQRLYELDADGHQVGKNAESPMQGPIDPRFLPCADGYGANWFRRPYFQRAIARPGRIQTSRPYLSIRDARSCVTLSVAFGDRERLRVLCADLDHEQPEPPSFRTQYGSGVRRK